ncbi:MAG: NUDIX domain-containing protein [Flavobacteriaceae bacterium]
MDELVEIFDQWGMPIGEIVPKSVAHKKGLYHPTAHVWLYTASGMVLLQQRGRHKDTHPLLWDVSVAGHIASGEAYTKAAIREVQEEIGLSIKEEDLKKIGVYKSVHQHSDTLIDCEFNHTYLCKLSVSLEALTKQESEVEALKLMPLVQFEKEVLDPAKASKFVPHENSYYTAVIEAIKAIL